MKTESDLEITLTTNTATVDLITIARVCLKHRWIILLTVLSSVIATVALDSSEPLTYRSIATINTKGPGKMWVETNNAQLFWQNEDHIHEVAEREKINLERANVKAQANYEPSDNDNARVVIEVVADNPGVSKRLAKSLADDFVETANILSDRPHEINRFETKHRDELVLQRKRIELVRNQRRSLQEDAEALRETIFGSSVALRDAPTLLMLDSQRREVLNSLLDVDDRLLSLRMTVEDLKWKRALEVRLRVLKVDSVSEPLKKEKRTLFNGIVAGFVAFVVTAFLLYFREFRRDRTERPSA